MSIYYVKTETTQGKLYDTITITRITKEKFKNRTHKIFIEDGLSRSGVCRAAAFAVCEMFEYADKAIQVNTTSRLGWNFAYNQKYRQATGSSSLLTSTRDYVNRMTIGTIVRSTLTDALGIVDELQVGKNGRSIKILWKTAAIWYNEEQAYHQLSLPEIATIATRQRALSQIYA